MKLSDYLKSKSITQSEFAALIGKTRATVNRYCTGASSPDFKTIGVIVALTNHEVTANDFMADNPPATEAAE